MPNNHATLTAYGENLGNRVYAVTSANLLTTAFGTALAAFGAPRTFGLELSYKL
jgi:outer membrane receptor protein involved in Fe transport